MLGQSFDVIVFGLVVDVAVERVHGDTDELEVAVGFFADDLNGGVWGVSDLGGSGAEQVGVVAAAEPAVGADDQDEFFAHGRLGRAEQRIGNLAGLAEGGSELADDLADPLGVELGFGSPFLHRLETGGGDHLHRFGDALDVPDRLDPALDFTCSACHRRIMITTDRAGATSGVAWPGWEDLRQQQFITNK